MGEPHLQGRHVFTFFHVKELILLGKWINVWLFDIFGTLIESFQSVSHFLVVLQGETEWYSFMPEAEMSMFLAFKS
jgi:hypothetical protein